MSYQSISSAKVMSEVNINNNDNNIVGEDQEKNNNDSVDENGGKLRSIIPRSYTNPEKFAHKATDSTGNQ